MHTAVQLNQTMLEVQIDGAVKDSEALLAEWGPYDRLGLVVTEPLGAVGASHLIQLAITAFYDQRHRDGLRTRTIPRLISSTSVGVSGNIAPTTFGRRAKRSSPLVGPMRCSRRSTTRR